MAILAVAASAGARMAYVAGGQNVYGRPLQSALAYEVTADASVAGGQGILDWTTEVFDVAGWRWTVKQGKLLEEVLINPSTGMAAVEGRVYKSSGRGEVDVCSDNGGEVEVGVEGEGWGCFPGSYLGYLHMWRRGTAG